MKSRLRTACMLLRNTVMSIDEIASRCDFYDRFQFSRMFKKYRHITPVEFRKQNAPTVISNSH